jgi:hypothetical protein
MSACFGSPQAEFVAFQCGLEIGDHGIEQVIFRLVVPERDLTVHIVLDDLDKPGRVYRETDEAEADLDTVIDDITSGQYESPRRVAAFNIAEGWACHVTKDVAREVLARATNDGRALGASVRNFIERETGHDRWRLAQQFVHQGRKLAQ